MVNPEINIAIPTYNRSGLLRQTLESALAQDYAAIRINIFDNCSSDDTAAVICDYNDRRIAHIRHPENIGLFRNFNRIIATNESPYLLILQDDDLIDPEFVSHSMEGLLRYPHAGLAFTDSSFIDEEGAVIGQQEQSRFFSPGLVNGAEYLRRIVAGENLVIHVSNVIMKASALSAMGPFDAIHARTSIDFNLYFRLASKFDLVYIDRNLSQIRRHEGADHLHSEADTRPLAMLAERTDAATYLLESELSGEPDFRRWLAERLRHLSMRRSELTAEMIPDYRLSVEDRRQEMEQALRALVPPGSRVILVDDGQFGADLLPACTVLPFIERDGQYWGPPDDSRAAVRELERMRSQGSRYVVIAWPAHWWFDYYSGMRDHMLDEYDCVRQNSLFMIFDMLAEASDSAGQAE